MSSDKNQLLEPITAVARLITLAFEPKGTKLAIRDHNVVLCKPSADTYYGIKIPQSVDRYINGDSRDDIYVLNHVICNFIEWYIIPYSKKQNDQTDRKLYKGLINMVMYLCVGLKELQSTYKLGTAVGTLQYYINVLLAVANNTFQPDMLYNPSITELSSFLDSPVDAHSVMYSTIFDIDKFKCFWSREELTSLCDQFDQCFIKHDKDDKYVFQSDDELNSDSCQSVDGIYDQMNKFGIEDMNDSKESESITNNGGEVTSHKKKNHSHGHSHGHNHGHNHSCQVTIKTLPVPKSQKNAILQGDLVGIAKILSIMDRKFTNMLNNSVKGM
jgi:hypothetical protein